MAPLTEVLRASLRVDDIGDIDRETNLPSKSVLTPALTEDTRFPFVINIPQHELEPVLRDALDERAPGVLRFGQRVTGFAQHNDRVTVHVEHQGGDRTVDVRYLLACDGGRSQIREQLGITVEGHTLADRYMLVDVLADLDVTHPREYPYLAYFGDPQEWMILVRQPHCWRFLFPMTDGGDEPTRQELGEKARRFIGDVLDLEVLGSNVYTVHHRVADRWQDGRIFLMGDAAHLITPMWALGLNTGVLDASNLPWRLAWVLRGWATPKLLEGYETEQGPVAIEGVGRDGGGRARLHVPARRKGLGDERGQLGQRVHARAARRQPRRRRHRRLVDGPRRRPPGSRPRRRPRAGPAPVRRRRDRAPPRPRRGVLRRPLLHRHATAAANPDGGRAGLAPLRGQPLGRPPRVGPARAIAVRSGRPRPPAPRP